MKTRALTLLITLLLVFSNIGMAQITDPLSIGKSPQLKTDIVGSYPQTIMEYNWMVEMWMLLQTSYISYNAQGDPTEIRVVGMKEEYRTLFTYNSDHFETESLRQNKEGGTWVNFERTTTEYERDFYPKKVYAETWNGSGWDMEFGTQYNYTYDGDLITVFEMQIWNKLTGEWINSARTTQSYSNNSMSEAITESWENGAWVNSSKMRYVWVGDKVSELYMAAWTDGAWDESTKMVYEYGDNESTVLTMYSSTGDGNWTPAQRFTDTFDSHGNLILTKIEFYTMDWQMLSGNKYLLTYDGDNITERITQMYGFGEPESTLAAGTTEWRNVYREVYSDFASLSVDQLVVGAETVQNFPNPARDETILKLSNLENTNLTVSVLNLNGQVTLSERIYVPVEKYSYSLNLSELPSGTFILLVKDQAGKVLSSSRLVLQK